MPVKNGLSVLNVNPPSLDGVLLSISVATIEDADGNITEKLVTDIEALLIYAAWNDHMVNKRSVNSYSGRQAKQLMIKNYGYTLFSQQIFWGACSSHD